MDTHDPPKIQPVATIEAGEEIPERSCGLYLGGDDLLYGDNDKDTLVGGRGPYYFEGSFGDDVHTHHHPRSTSEGHIVYTAAGGVLLEVEAAVADDATLDRPADDPDAQSGVYHGREHAEHVDVLHGVSLPADGR